ncbi:MAG TPA: hypothetical protein VGC88_06275 [Terriglobales bacterium]|jgi:hypothetical protein
MWKALKSYIWWTHPRGSLQYDVMVTLILAFIFASPHFIDFRDKPRLAEAHQSEREYVIPASDLGAPDGDVTAALQRRLQSQDNHAEIEHFEALHDSSGNIAAYRVFVKQ